MNTLSDKCNGLNCTITDVLVTLLLDRLFSDASNHYSFQLCSLEFLLLLVNFFRRCKKLGIFFKMQCIYVSVFLVQGL